MRHFPNSGESLMQHQDRVGKNSCTNETPLITSVLDTDWISSQHYVLTSRKMCNNNLCLFNIDRVCYFRLQHTSIRCGWKISPSQGGGAKACDEMTADGFMSCEEEKQCRWRKEGEEDERHWPLVENNQHFCQRLNLTSEVLQQMISKNNNHSIISIINAV